MSAPDRPAVLQAALRRLEHLRTCATVHRFATLFHGMLTADEHSHDILPIREGELPKARSRQAIFVFDDVEILEGTKSDRGGRGTNPATSPAEAHVGLLLHVRCGFGLPLYD